MTVFQMFAAGFGRFVLNGDFETIKNPQNEQEKHFNKGVKAAIKCTFSEKPIDKQLNRD